MYCCEGFDASNCTVAMNRLFISGMFVFVQNVNIINDQLMN